VPMAIERGRAQRSQGDLGRPLFQVVFSCAYGGSKARSNFAAVAAGSCPRCGRVIPTLFADAAARSAE